MGFCTKQTLLFSSPLFLFIFFTILAFFPFATTAVDYTAFVYKGCTNQKDTSDVYTQNLKSLMTSLVAQSQNQKTFFSSTSGDSPNAVKGLYQCRGDLSTSDCSTCVSKLPSLAQKYCGQALAARVQLSGCYLRYESSGFAQVPDDQLLYKVCRSSSSSAGFELKKDTAFDLLDSGIKNGTGLFYAGNYESVYVLGQCEGDLGKSDCADCVKSASDKADSDCGNSASGQIYLQKCYISYSYYANGLPNLTSSSGSKRSATQKTVALVVGGVAAVAFLIVCLMFVKSLMKKRGAKHGDYY